MTGKNMGAPKYWDTCMFIHAVHRKTPDAALLEEIDSLIKQCGDGDIIICTSVITHIEASPERLKDAPRKQAFLKRLYDFIEFVDMNTRVAKLAAEIRDFYSQQDNNNLSMQDCIHLASAIYIEAAEFHTTDGTGAKSQKGKLLTLTNPIAGKYGISIKVPRATQPSLLSNVSRIAISAKKPN